MSRPGRTRPSKAPPLPGVLSCQVDEERAELLERLLADSARAAVGEGTVDCLLRWIQLAHDDLRVAAFLLERRAQRGTEAPAWRRHGWGRARNARLVQEVRLKGCATGGTVVSSG